MAKKPAQTFHPLAVAKSLEEQNQAFGMLLMKIETAKSLSEKIDAAQAQKLIADIAAQAEIARRIMWPEED